MIGRNRKRQFLALGIVLAVILTGIAGCGRKPQDDATLAAFCPNGENHEFDMEITQADCTQRGYTTGTCQKCGYTYMYDMLNALGHQWGEPVYLKAASCTEDGLQNISCSRCGLTQEESIAHSGHSYALATEEGDEAQETVEYVCTVCGDVITRNWDEPLVEELKEKTFLPDRSADFTFLVCCDQGEDYLRNNLTLTGEHGAVSYDITVEENGIYRIAATEPYEQYQTYQVRLAGDMLFPEYNAKALDFSIIGPDRAEVEFNDDNLVFLKKLELREYGKSGLYELQWDEAAQRYYLTLFELRDIKPSMIGKVIGIGDYTSTAEILADSTRELCFAKLERISHNAEGDLLLELSVPQLSEVYDKLDIYFTGNAEQMRISGDPEQAFISAVVNSEDFAEYLTATHLAAESYASTYGLVVTPLAETSKDNLQFELTKSSLKKTENGSACLLELGGKITYTIPLKSKAGQASGSIVMNCNAEITARISAGGYFNNKDSVDLHLTNETTTTLSFDMDFNLEYSNAYEEIYLLNKNTQKIHTATCRIAKKETNSANLQKLTAQELSEWYHGDRETMQKHECKVCLAVTGLDGAAYAYNKNTGVLHCMNCRHVTNIKDCNLYTLYPDNTLGFTTCADCQPAKRQTKDFDNRMLNAIRGSDWAEQVSNFQSILGDSIGEKKPAEEREPILSVPINIAGIFNIEIGVAPVFEFDMEASVNFTITGNTSNTYGIHNVGEGYETYHHEQPGKVDYNLNFTGEADAKFGICLMVEAYPVGLEKAAYISIGGQVGLYGHFTGILSVQGTVGSDTDAFCAARLEVGLYARMDGYWKILWFDNNFKIIEEKRWPLFKWGYDRMYYAFEEEEIEWLVDNPDEFVMFNLPLLMKAKYLDLTTMEYKTDTISPISKSHLNVTVEIKNEDGSSCDYLEYIPQNGMIHKKDNAPESFTAVITVRVTPKVQIESLREFFASETKKLRFGYSMDPLVVTLKVEEKKTQPTKKQLIKIIRDNDHNVDSERTFSYNAKGQLTSIITTWLYDDGDVREVVDMRYEYDSDERLVRIFEGKNDDPMVEYIYDENGRLTTKVSEYESISTYEYDASGKIIKCISEDIYSKSVTEYTYDGQGLLKETLRNTEWTFMDTTDVSKQTYYYDAQRRLITEVYESVGSENPYTSTTTYCYDYMPFVLITHDSDTDNPVLALYDDMGNRLWSESFQALDLVSDESGYLISATTSGEVASNPYFATLDFIYDAPGTEYDLSVYGDTGSDYSAMYEAFLSNRGYLPDWTELGISSYYTLAGYSLIDIDQNETDELVIVSNSDIGFFAFLVYTIDEKSGEVVRLPAARSDVENNILSCYGDLRYSPKYKALVFSETKPTAMYGGVEYFVVAGDCLYSIGTVGADSFITEGKMTYYSTLSGSFEEISEIDRDGYISELTWLDYHPLP